MRLSPSKMPPSSMISDWDAALPNSLPVDVMVSTPFVVTFPWTVPAMVTWRAVMLDRACPLSPMVTSPRHSMSPVICPSMRSDSSAFIRPSKTDPSPTSVSVVFGFSFFFPLPSMDVSFLLSLIQVRHRIDVFPVFHHFEMQMRARAPARGAEQADLFALFHPLAFFHQVFAQVEVVRLQAAFMPDRHVIAQAAIVAGLGDEPVRPRVHRIAAPAGDVDAGGEGGAARERIFAVSEGGRDARRLRRPERWRDALFVQIGDQVFPRDGQIIEQPGDPPVQLGKIGFGDGGHRLRIVRIRRIQESAHAAVVTVFHVG